MNWVFYFFEKKDFKFCVSFSMGFTPSDRMYTGDQSGVVDEGSSVQPSFSNFDFLAEKFVFDSTHDHLYILNVFVVKLKVFSGHKNLDCHDVL